MVSDVNLHPYSEVEKAISVYAAYLQERDFIDGIFDRYDTNKDQVLDREELTGYCKELNEVGLAKVQARPRLESAWFQKLKLMKEKIAFKLTLNSTL